MPPVPGSELAEAVALALDIGLAVADAEDMALAVAEALDVEVLIMSSSIISSSSIIRSLCMFAAAAGARTSAANRARDTDQLTFPPYSRLPERPTVVPGVRIIA